MLPNKKINLLIPQSRISTDKSPSQRDHPSDEYKGYSQMATQSDMDAFSQKVHSSYNDTILT